MTVFSGNCEECGSLTTTYCEGSLVLLKIVVDTGVHYLKERVIFCPVCAKVGKKKIKAHNRKMKGLE